MGLDCSHDAFSGAYSAFNRFRQCVAEAAGGSFPPHWIYEEGGKLAEGSDGRVKYKPDMKSDLIYLPDGCDKEGGFFLFMKHEDCDGEFTPEECVKVADALEALLPAIEAIGWTANGHIARDGGFVAVTKRFIAGCRAAAAEGIPLGFH